MPKQIRLEGALVEVRMASFGLPADLMKEVKVKAAQDDISANALIIKALRFYLLKEFKKGSSK